MVKTQNYFKQFMFPNSKERIYPKNMLMELLQLCFGYSYIQ